MIAWSWIVCPRQCPADLPDGPRDVCQTVACDDGCALFGAGAVAGRRFDGSLYAVCAAYQMGSRTCEAPRCRAGLGAERMAAATMDECADADVDVVPLKGVELA